MNKVTHAILTIAALLLCGCNSYNSKRSIPEEDVIYQNHFSTERLRVDLVFCGARRSQSAFLKEIHREQIWSGSPESRIDEFGHSFAGLGDEYYDSETAYEGFCPVCQRAINRMIDFYTR